MRSALVSGQVVVGTFLLVGCSYFDFFDHIPGHGGHHHPPKPPDPTCDPDLHVASSKECIRKAAAISVGNRYACAILVGGELKCWGYDVYGVLGQGPAAQHLGDQPGELGDALPAVDLGTDRTALTVTTDSDVTCALLDDLTVKCWGYNGYRAASIPPWNGQMGDALPIAPLPPSPVVDIGAIGGTAYALLANGGLYYWGHPVASLRTFEIGSRVVQFELGQRYSAHQTCGLHEDGSVLCAGGGRYGELGRAPADGFYEEDPLPVALGAGRTAVELALGLDHSCALLDDGAVKCWGRNQYGQLGLGDTALRGLDPTEMGDALPAVPLGQPALSVTAGTDHTCALLADGTVRCWGRNDDGQLGLGDAENRGDDPGEVAALPALALGGAVQAIDGGTHTCALLESGAVKCWGPNQYGQLGLGDVATRGDQPDDVAALTPVDLGE